MPSDELVEIVNEKGEVLYETTLGECKTKGLLHRSVATFLRNSGKEVLLQRRSFSDDWLPGRWTVSATGHVKAGESPDSASIRELREELGIEGKPSFLFKQLIPSISWAGSIEYEVAYAFEVISDAKPSPDPGEVEEVRFFSPEKCKSLIGTNGGDLTPDAVILLSRYLGNWAVG